MRKAVPRSLLVLYLTFEWFLDGRKIFSFFFAGFEKSIFCWQPAAAHLQVFLKPYLQSPEFQITTL